MKILKYPDRQILQEALKRPAMDVSRLFGIVQEVMDSVRNEGDEAIRKLEEKFDKVKLDDLKVKPEEFDEAEAAVEESLKDSIQLAASNIRRFHTAQKFESVKVETAKGIICEQKAVPIEKVGLYVPGGSAPLFSTVLMLAIPAKIAGCSEIVLCSPPNQAGKIHPAVLYAAKLSGVDKVYKIGGSQAIAAMAYGTESVPKVNKIFGPGNQYVTAAKQLVSLSDVAIDMPAGPSEVEVLADGNANIQFVVADLLSQAEHGADSQVVVVTTSESIIPLIEKELEKQLDTLSRKDICLKSLDHSIIVLAKDMDEAIVITNEYAPEHLILSVENYREVALQITHAGSVFMGKYSCESAGDYASGTNHTLPTKGYARMYSGLSLDSFIRKMTFQELSEEGVKSIGKAVMKMAEAESLTAHMMAMKYRYDSIKGGDK